MIYCEGLTNIKPKIIWSHDYVMLHHKIKNFLSSLLFCPSWWIWIDITVITLLEDIKFEIHKRLLVIFMMWCTQCNVPTQKNDLKTQLH